MARRPMDAYYTGGVAVKALRDRVTADGVVLEPCNGIGAISKQFADCRVITNELDAAKPADFHEDAKTFVAPHGVDWVVTNPPFDAAFEILRNFYDQGLKCAFLLRLSFLEPTFDRGAWLEAHPPDGVIVLPRYSFTGDNKTDSVTCAWMIWSGTPLEPRIQIVSKGDKDMAPRKKKVKDTSPPSEANTETTASTPAAEPALPVFAPADALPPTGNGPLGFDLAPPPPPVNVSGLSGMPLVPLFGAGLSVAAQVSMDLGIAAAAALPAVVPTTPPPQAGVAHPTTAGGKSRVPPFNHLKTTIKAGADVALGPCTAITGQLRSGKSTILDAVTFGLTGRHPAGPNSTDLMELARPGATSAEVMLTSPSGSAHHEVLSGKRPADKPEFFGQLASLTDEERERILPGASMQSFLVGDKKAREATFRRFGGNAFTGVGAPTPANLNPDQLKYWAAGAAEVMRTHTDPAEILSEMNGWMRRAKLAAGRTISALESQLQENEAKLASLGAGSEMLPELEKQYAQAIASENLAGTRAQLEQAKSDLAAFEARAASFIAGQTAFAECTQKLKDQHGQIDAVICKLSAELTEAQAAVKAFEPKVRRIVAVDEILGAMVEGNVRSCPVCRADDKDPKVLRAEIQSILAERTKAAAENEIRVSALTSNLRLQQQEQSDTQRSLDNLSFAREQERSSIKTGAGFVQARIAELEKVISGAGGGYAGPASGVVKAEIDRLHAADGVRGAVASIKQQIGAKKTEQKIAKELEKEAEELLQTMLSAVVHVAQKVVNQYSGFPVVLDISNGGCEWRVVGDDGRPHNVKTMSGSERASMLIALACAWTEGSPLRVLLLDDAELGPFRTDPIGLQAFLGRLEDCVKTGLLTQVIVSGLLPGDVPAGWTTIAR